MRLPQRSWPRYSSSAPPELDRVAQQRIGSRHLPTNVVRQGSGTRRKVRARQCHDLTQPTLDVVDAERIDEHTGTRMNELRRTANASCEHAALATHRLDEHLPKWLHRAGQTQYVARANPGDDLIVRNPSDETDACTPLERASKRAITDDRQRSFLEPFECLHEPTDVLALVERAHEQERRLVATHAGPASSELASRILVQPWRKSPLHIDSGVDHLNPPLELWHASLEIIRQKARDGDDMIGSTSETSHAPRDPSSLADIAHVTPVRHDDQPGARQNPTDERSDHACWRQKMRIYHVWAPTQHRPRGPNCKAEVLGDPTAAASHAHDMDAVAQLAERMLLATHEHAQIGIPIARVHLRHDHDVEGVPGHVRERTSPTGIGSHRAVNATRPSVAENQQ